MICLPLQQAINCRFIKKVTYLIEPSNPSSATDYVVGFDSDEMEMTMVINFCPFCGESFLGNKPDCYPGHVEIETQDREVID